jgi:sulfite reductase (NADPH) flavoprotein alpha-component
MTTLKTNNFPFDSQQNQLIEQLLKSLDLPGLYWLHGYIQSQIQSRQGNNGISGADTLDKIKLNGTVHPGQKLMPVITVLFGTHTGNSRKIASRLYQLLENVGHPVRMVDIADFKARDIKSEKFLILIISTHGEGQPPLAAEDFYEYIHSEHAPALSDLSFSILGLGDKSYLSFCKTASDIDLRLEKLGGRRLIPRIDCDVDYVKSSEQWIDAVLQSLPKIKHVNPTIKIRDNSKPVPVSLPGRGNPIEAQVFNKIRLNGRGSQKSTYHLEVQLPSEEMFYEPGDSVGIIPQNSQILVNEIIDLFKAKPQMPVDFGHSTGPLSEILLKEVEITKLTKENLENYNKLVCNNELNNILQNSAKTGEFLNGTSWVDLMHLYPGNIAVQNFLSIARPVQPRLYSISSSALAYPGEVHLTVRRLNFNLHGKTHLGVCSSYLSELPESQASVRMFFETNEGFRLPPEDTDIIMIGPGTGVAPFRAFMQEREHTQAKGKNWLFFGDCHFTTDFLYQTEWQSWHKKSLLHRIDLAFSRDQHHKIYVQHRLLEKSREVYQWLENGARIYVCGDMKKMAPDVVSAFKEIVRKEGGMTVEKANEYVKNLRKEKRYHEDVY